MLCLVLPLAGTPEEASEWMRDLLGPAQSDNGSVDATREFLLNATETSGASASTVARLLKSMDTQRVVIDWLALQAASTAAGSVANAGGPADSADPLTEMRMPRAGSRPR